MEEMTRKILLSAIILLSAVICSGQKSRVLSVFQLIESKKYKEAKEAIELAIWNDRTSRWPRTFFAKGLLCQTAFEEGFEKNDTEKTELYPDQLYLAYAAYERALKLDKRERLHSAVASRYYKLSNDFQKLGKRHFERREYAEAMKAFEHALLVGQSPLLSVKADTGLIYNTAIAAYESKNWEKAIGYLTGLNSDSYSPEVALLLYHSHMGNGDSAAAVEILVDGVDRYGGNEDIVLRLVELYVRQGQQPSAIALLDTAASRQPGNHVFPWTTGQIYQRMERYQEAIESYTRAIALEPSQVDLYYNLGICYYNMGVEINESARKIRNQSMYREARSEAREKFTESVKWLEKAYELDPGEQKTISRLYQLYYQLQMDEKRKTMEMLMRRQGTI